MGAEAQAQRTPTASTPNASEEQSTEEEAVKNVPYHRRNVRNYMTSIPILLCCFCSGLVDSAVFNAWGVFATMQTGNYSPFSFTVPSLRLSYSSRTNSTNAGRTGNTIILALGASHQPVGHPRAWLQALLAISAFFIGALFHARYTRPLGPSRHTTLASSFFIQTSLLTTAAALIQSGVVPGILHDALSGGGGARSEPWITLVPLPMLSFQAGMQSVTARQLGFNEIPTTVLTSCFCDLGNDPNLFVGVTKNWQRNRRIGSVIAILLGGIIGGWLSRTSNGMPTNIWMAAAVKGVIVIAWFLWPDEKPKAEEK
jgi:uncharacterized membrane protein YoaK (UPF0700 family)